MSAIVICAAAGAALCPVNGVPFLATAVGITLGGAAGNFFQDLSNAVFEWFDEHSWHANQHPKNRDFDALVAQAISRCIKVSLDHLTKDDPMRPSCERLVGSGEEIILAVLRSEEFREMSENDATAVLGTPNGGVDTQTKTPEYWIRFVAEVASRSRAGEVRPGRARSFVEGIVAPLQRDLAPIEVDPAIQRAVAFAAGHIHLGVATQANDILRATFGVKGRPYVAAQMAYANKTLDLVTEEAKKNQARHAELLPVAQGLHRSIDELATALGTMLDAKVAPLLATTNEVLALSRQAFGILSGLQNSVYEVVRGNGEMIQLLTSGPRLKPLLLLPGGEPGTLRGARRIDLILRESETRELLEFLVSDQRVAWQLWHGAAGMGKSRLAFELCRLVDRSWEGKPSVWAAGFLDLPKVVITDWMQWKVSRPTLIVIDYALERAEEIRLFIEQVAQDALVKLFPPVRFLLLEREEHSGLIKQLLPAGDSDGWLENAAHRGDDGEARPTRALTPFAKDNLATVIQAVYDARLRATPSGTPPKALPDAQTVATKLGTATFELRPLFAILGAEAAIEGNNPATLSHEGLARDWLGHEFKAWRKSFPANQAGESSYQRHVTLVVLATLAQGLPCAGPYRTLHDSLTPTGVADLIPPADTFASNWDTLTKFYSLGKSDAVETIPALRPDYLGELLVLDRFKNEVTTTHAQLALVRAALTANASGFIVFLQHAADSHPRHPALQAILERALELCPQGARPWPCPWGEGSVEVNLSNIAWSLNSQVLARAFSDRVLALPSLPARSAVHLIKVIDLRDRSKDKVRDLLNLLLTSESATAYHLGFAAATAWYGLNDKALTRKFLEKVRDHAQAGPDPLTRAAATAWDVLKDEALTRALLKKVHDHPQTESEHITLAASTAWRSQNDKVFVRALLEKARDHPQATSTSLAKAARAAWGVLKDKDLTRTLLEKVRDHPQARPQPLVLAASTAWRSLKDESLTRTLLEKVRDHHQAGPHSLVEAAGKAWGTLKDGDLTRTLLEKVRDHSQASSHSLGEAAIAAWGALKDQDLTRTLLEKVRDHPQAAPHPIADAAGTAWNALKDEDLTRTLLKKVRDHPQTEPDPLAEAAGTAWRRLKDEDLTRTLLKKVGDHLQAGPNALAEAAATAWDALKDEVLTRTLVERVREHPKIEPDSLSRVASTAWIALKDKSLVRALVEKVRDHPHAVPDTLAGAAVTAWESLKDENLVRTLLKNAELQAVADPVMMARLAAWRWTIDQDLSAAEAKFSEALKLRRSSGIVCAFRCVVLICAGKSKQGQSLLRQTLNTMHQLQPSRLVAGLWFVAYASKLQPESRRALTSLKSMHPKDFSFGLMLPLGLVINHLVPSDHAERTWLEKLSLVIGGKADPLVLAEWEKWKAA